MSNLISPDFNKPKPDMAWIKLYPHMYTLDKPADTITFTEEGFRYYNYWFTRYGLTLGGVSLQKFREGCRLINDLLLDEVSKGVPLEDRIKHMPPEDQAVWSLMLEGNFDEFVVALKARAAALQAQRKPASILSLAEKKGIRNPLLESSGDSAKTVSLAVSGWQCPIGDYVK